MDTLIDWAWERGHDIATRIKAVRPHMSTDDSRPGLCVMQAAVRSGELFVEATDSYTLARAELGGDIDAADLDPDMDVTAPLTADVVKALAAARPARQVRLTVRFEPARTSLGDVFEVTIAIDGAEIVYRYNRPSEGRFPDLDSMIPRDLVPQGRIPDDVLSGGAYRFACSPGHLAKFAPPHIVVRKKDGRDAAALLFAMCDPARPVVVRVCGMPWFIALMMPIRLDSAVERIATEKDEYDRRKA